MMGHAQPPARERAHDRATTCSPSDSLHITLQILSIFYTFIAFLCIGLPIAVLPMPCTISWALAP